MNRIVFVLLLLVLTLTMALPAFAQGENGCPHDAATIEALRNCVAHGMEMGHLSAAAGRALLERLDAAQTVLDQGQTEAAIAILGGFIRTVAGLPAKHVAPEHAEHIAMHAQMVIEALQ